MATSSERRSNFYAQYNIMMIRRLQWDVELLVHCNDIQISLRILIHIYIHIWIVGGVLNIIQLCFLSHGNKSLLLNPKFLPFYDYEILCVCFCGELSKNNFLIDLFNLYSKINGKPVGWELKAIMDDKRWAVSVEE
jgi:hypothetical protein